MISFLITKTGCILVSSRVYKFYDIWSPNKLKTVTSIEKEGKLYRSTMQISTQTIFLVYSRKAGT